MIRAMLRQFSAPLMLLALCACGTVTQPCPLQGHRDVVYVVERGWHAEIGIPADELDGGMAYFRTLFPGARVIMFGYGKKTFFTAPPEALSEYILGPFPGAAAIHAVGIRVTPPEAYGPENIITLVLPAGGRKSLSSAIWNDLGKDDSGKPRAVSLSSDPDGVFYAALSGYSLLHTCNTWAADILHDAGLPTSGDGVMFSGQVMGQAVKVAGGQCRSLFGN